MTGRRAWFGHGLIKVFAGPIEVGFPHFFLRRGRFGLFALLNILGKLGKSTIETFLVRVVVFPFLTSFAPILEILISWVV